MRKTYLMILFLFALPLAGLAQVVPDIEGFRTLKCDLHMHTVYSDGLVWPTFRVREALNEDLDAIAITDHLEYLPHRKYFPEDMNISYDIAVKYANRMGVICIKGAEITRWMPPGHFNAIFIEDANKLLIKEFLPVVEEAIRQGAFIFWNHPGWIVHQPDRVVRWYDIHSTLVERGWLHGIEFANSREYYPGALEYTEKYDLAVLGNSDVHGCASEMFAEDAHRPLTLVFAEKRSKEAIREALFAGRSIALSAGDVMAGPETLTRTFVTACMDIDTSGTAASIVNRSGIAFILSDSGGNEFVLPPLGSLHLPAFTETGWTVLNVYTGKDRHLQLGSGK